MRVDRNLKDAYFVGSLRLTFIGLALLFAGLLVLPVMAQEDEPVVPEEPVVREVSDDEVNAVAKDLYCPVCENTPLDVCPTKACADWRELIRTKLAQGESKQDIFDYFVRQYGDSALAQRPKTGINFVLWLLPFVAVGLGLVFFARFMKGLRTEEPVAAGVGEGVVDMETAVPEEPAPDDYMARVEQELKEK
jgi:cytochrome c-type biogenesis protein CcmH